MPGKTFVKGQDKSRGLPPGTPVYIGQDRKEPVHVTLIDFDETHVVEKEIADLKECFPFRKTPSVTWINIVGIHDPEPTRILGEHFGFHPLVQEDILNTGQRAKVEDYGTYVYGVIKMVRWDAEAGEMIIEQVSLIIGANFVMSFQEQEGDVFESVRDRIRKGKGRIRSMGPDYLAYSLLDAVVDGYFAVLENLGEQLESVEDETIMHPSADTLHNIYRMRQQGLLLRKSIWPARELVSGLERLESPLLSDVLKPYLRNLYDHVVQVIDTTETSREMLSGLLDTYLSSLSNRMNEVMKVLTIIATIFIPLTFIAGVYGMNFRFMPELDWPWGYPLVLTVMLAVVLLMLAYFRRKKWL